LRVSFCLQSEITLEEVRKMDHEKDVVKIENVNELLKKPYQNEFEAAAITGRAVSTLRNERHLRRGLPYLKIGKRSVRYKTADIIATMEARRISFEQDKGEA
jgi:hypothetical protein